MSPATASTQVRVHAAFGPPGTAATRVGVTVASSPPGIVRTGLARHVSLWQKVLIEPVSQLLFLDVEGGAQTTLHCCLQEGLEPLSGRYFSCCSVQEASGEARDDAVARRLWEVSEALCGRS